MTYAFPVNSDVIGYDDNGRPIGDRVFNADDLADVVETFFTNGVIMKEGSFQVSPSSGMSVVVGTGKCIIEGRGKNFPEPRTMVLQASDPTYDRMDTIVLRWNSARAVRDIDIFVKSGTPQTNPVAPTLTRGEQVYELGICNILVPKNSTTVSASRITDTRLDDSRCGIASALIDVDTTSFYAQLEAATNEAVELAQDALEGTIAGNLQGQIDEIDDFIENTKFYKVGGRFTRGVLQGGDAPEFWAIDDDNNYKRCIQVTEQNLRVLDGNGDVVGTIRYLQKSLLKVETKTVTVNIAANSVSDFNFNVALSGYTPIGIVGWNNTDSGGVVHVVKAFISGTNAAGQIVNRAGSAKNGIVVTLNVLYIANS